MEAFVVYELQPMPSRRETGERLGKRLPVRHSLQLVGCFIAEDAGQACRAAAESQQRSSRYVALQASVQQAQFAAADNGDLEELSGLGPNERDELQDELRKLREAMESIVGKKK